MFYWLTLTDFLYKLTVFVVLAEAKAAEAAANSTPTTFASTRVYLPEVC